MTDHPHRPTAMTARIPRKSAHPRRAVTALAVALGLALAAWGAPPPAAAAEPAATLPEFPHSAEALWLNGSPLSAEDLRGRVVLLDLFTEG